MDYRVLGPLEVLRDGRVVDVRGTKRRAVLALLLLRANEVVRTDRLIEEVWGDRPPSNASAALYNHVSRLRKTLGADVFVTKPWGYVLRADPDEIDAHRFGALVTDAASLPAQARAARLRDALALWRGPALADLLAEPAVADEAARLDDLRLAALEDRIDADLELGSHVAVIGELEALIAEEPLRERLRGQLIVALYRSGRQAEALEVYRETRRVLIDELGIEPGPELRRLEQAILRQDPALAVAPPPSRPPEPRRRSRALLLVAAVPLLAAGVASAVMLTRSTPAPVVTPTVSTERTTVTAAQRATATTHARRTVPATTQRRATTAAQRTVKHRPPPASTAASTTTPALTTRRAGTTTSTTTRAAVVAARWVWAPADTFADAGRTDAMWQAWTSGTGIDSGDRGGRLEIAIAGDAQFDDRGRIEAGYRLRCLTMADFDAQVGFQLIDWPTRNGVELTLGFAVGDGTTGAFWSVARVGGGNRAAWEAYVATVGGVSGAVETEDLTGALRLTRRDKVLTAYYKGSSGWIRIASGREPRFGNILLFVQTDRQEFGGRTATVAYDDFSSAVPEMFCNGPYFPPRTRSR